MKVPSRKRTRGIPIRSADARRPLRVPLDGLQPTVTVGERVRAGQVIASRADGAVRHSAWSGIVRAIQPWVEIEGAADEPLRLAPSPAAAAARAAGIVGMGGAAFPTFRKIELTGAARIVLINGCESEPYVTCDGAVLAEHRAEVECGMRLAMAAVGAQEGRVIADEAVAGYGSGYEGLLVERALGVRVPAGRRPSDFGAMVLNVQTAHALCRATCAQLPLLERVVTVDGGAIGRPGNLRAPIGARIADLLADAAADSHRIAALILGGPMMGRAADPEEGIGPGTIALLALTTEEVAAARAAVEPCLRCGWCEEACPFGLSACQLLEDPQASVLRCVECGACEYVCPSHRPLVAMLRAEKREVRRGGGGT